MSFINISYKNQTKYTDGMLCAIIEVRVQITSYCTEMKSASLLLMSCGLKSIHYS